MTTNVSPGDVLDGNDPGDETLSRYRYQCCAAAINCVRLITEPADVVAIICENFEDVLIECGDGQFIGLQIKTRQLDQSPFSATDGVVHKAVARFCILDDLFPGRFKCFDFSTNHWFWEKSESKKNLCWILKKLKERKTAKGLRKDNPIRILVDAICEICGLHPEKVAATLCKTILNSYGEPIDGIDQRVVTAVGECPKAATLQYSQNVSIAKQLIGRTIDASSRKIEDATTQLYAAGSQFSDVLDAYILAGKRITKTDVDNIIQEQSVTTEPLELSGLMPIGNLPKHLAVMIQKLDRGGLEVARIQEMSDLVRSFEHLLLRWTNRYGVETAEERYQDLLTKVRFDCTEARVSVETHDETYAPAMYHKLLSRLKDRVADEYDQLHGCSTEHLVGAAGMLTQQCKAWWSPKFDVEEAQ